MSAAIFALIRAYAQPPLTPPPWAGVTDPPAPDQEGAPAA